MENKDRNNLFSCQEELQKIKSDYSKQANDIALMQNKFDQFMANFLNIWSQVTHDQTTLSKNQENLQEVQNVLQGRQNELLELIGNYVSKTDEAVKYFNVTTQTLIGMLEQEGGFDYYAYYNATEHL